ncbi:MAG: DUF167 domain-containing protein [Candidatus Promineifilaceae bacterium]
MKLLVRVVPGAARDEVAGWLDGRLKVRVRARAEKGKANAAVRQFLADVLGISKERVTIASGHTSSRKVIDIAGLDEAQVRAKLAHIEQ